MNLKERVKSFAVAIWQLITIIYGWFDYWRNLAIEIFKRLIDPLRYPTYVIYFLVVIVFVGGLGFWIPFFQKETTSMVLAQQLSTYLLAIAAASFADICFNFFTNLKRGKEDEDEEEEFRINTDKKNSTMMSLWSFAFMMTVATVALGIYCLVGTGTDGEQAYRYSLIGTALSLILWLLANYDNRKLKESFFHSYPPVAAVGRADTPVGEGVNQNGNIDLG